MTIFNRILFLLLFLTTGLAFGQKTVYVKFSDGVSHQQIENAIKRPNLADRPVPENFTFSKAFFSEDDRLSRIYKLTIPEGTDPSVYIEEFQQNSLVEYFQDNVVYKVDSAPNDSLYGEQWALKNIKAEKAWEITKGSSEIIIGVIDTGIDYFHEDLSGNIFVNTAEDLNGNGYLDEADLDGIDNDNNGYIDDVSGWDFTDRDGFPTNSSSGDYTVRDNDPMDEFGHGTQVAGIAAAINNNGRGISGIAPGCRILNLRAFDPGGYGEEDDVASAILYAVQMGAKVINMSFGDLSYSMVLRDVVRYAASQGVILVASAGNSSTNELHYPSAFPDVISVAASGENDYMANFSNFGSTIDISAPGSFVFSTSPGNIYEPVSGTSFASPYVAGAAALILSQNPNYSNDEIKQLLKTSSDDIMDDGWDIRSGAGRLNVYTALRNNAASIIKFDYPLQNFYTKEDTLNVSVTALSPYFKNAEVFIGAGLEPKEWTALASPLTNQVVNQRIASIDISSFPDSVYTLRLKMESINGRIQEERSNFYISRNTPVVYLVNYGPGNYGEKPTVFASVYSETNTIARMFYRVKGSGAEYNFVTLDGFSTNNKFVKQGHFGFIPKPAIQSETAYEVYFSVNDPTGNDTTIYGEDGNPFTILTEKEPVDNSSRKFELTLPGGRIFTHSAKLSAGKEVLLVNDMYSSQNLSFYEYAHSGFVKTDSLPNRIPRGIGDFNNDGKIEIISSFGRSAYIDRQVSPDSYKFENVFADTSGDTWFIDAEDYDNDSRVEILAVNKETSLTIYQVNDDLTITPEAQLQNFSEINGYGNNFEDAEVLVDDIDNDGLNEIILIDRDGDVLAYKATGRNTYSNYFTQNTFFPAWSYSISSGDLNGDDKLEIILLMHSSENMDIAPFYIMFVMNFDKENGLVSSDIKAFIDPSGEYSVQFQNEEMSVKLDDLTGDGRDEIILFAFPYSYVYQSSQSGLVPVYYADGVNAKTIYTGDIDGNGVIEVAMPGSMEIDFVEFEVSDRPAKPVISKAYAISENTIRLEIKNNGLLTYIYRGISRDNLELVDSTLSSSFIDSLNITDGKYYYYSARTKDPSFSEMFSGYSAVSEVFAHEPAGLTEVKSLNQQNILLNFSGKVFPSILSLNSFKVKDLGIPNSVVLYNEYSYLCNFEEPLPTGEKLFIIEGLTDLFGSPIQADTAAFFVSSSESNPLTFYISDHVIRGNNQVEIGFNLEVDTTSILDKNNYSIFPNNKVEDVRLINSKRILVTSKNKLAGAGRETIIRLSGIYSAGNFFVLPDNAGSVISIISEVTTLEELYAYPNPYKATENNAITFANLPKNTEIYIYGISGNFVTKMTYNGDIGGMEWNGRNNSGEAVSSGIYICRAVQSDEEGNEKANKTIKIAIVK